MPVYPVVDAAVGDVVAHFRSEGSIDGTPYEVARHKFVGRNMVCGDYQVLGFALIDGPLYESLASFILCIEALAAKCQSVGFDAIEVVDATLGYKSIVGFNMSPKSGEDQVNLIREVYACVVVTQSIDCRS